MPFTIFTRTPAKRASVSSMAESERPAYSTMLIMTVAKNARNVPIKLPIVTAEIDPNRYDSKVFPPGAKSAKITAKPKPALRIMATAISPNCGIFSRIPSMQKPATIQLITAPITGSKPKIKPSPTPVSDTCESASLTMDVLRLIITMPISGSAMANISPAISVRRIKSNSSICYPSVFNAIG